MLAKNENKGGEMIEIMKHHHEEYVPFVAKETPIFIETLQEAVTFKATEMHSILFGSCCTVDLLIHKDRKERILSVTYIWNI